MSFSIIPDHIFYSEILPLLDFRTLYLMRNDNYLATNIYNYYIHSYPDGDRVLVALEFDDQDLLRDAMDEWSTYPYDANIDDKYYKDIFNIARNMRAMNSIATLLTYKGYDYISVMTYLRYDHEIVRLMKLDDRTRNYIMMKVTHSIVPTLWGGSSKTAYTRYIAHAISKYHTVSGKNAYMISDTVKLSYILNAISLAIIHEIDHDVLISMREDLIPRAIKEDEDTDIFRSVSSFHAFDERMDKEYSLEELYDRRLISTYWYRRWLDQYMMVLAI